MIDNFYEKPVLIFWTGGYDSTFRLCQLLIRYRVPVQPIYISDKFLDNKKASKTRRHNHVQELNSQKEIIKKLHSQFKFTKKLLKETIILEEVNYDEQIKKNMILLKEKKYVRRSKCQYGAMAQVTKNMDKYIEVCAEIGGFIHKRLKDKLKCNKKSCNYKEFIFDIKSEDNPLFIFNKFVLPLIDYNKEDMFNEAKQYNYEKILKLTWSCWYPRNGKPCNRCIMCRERFKKVDTIEHFKVNKGCPLRIYLIPILILLTILIYLSFRN